MNALLINSSSRINGNTSLVLHEYENKLIQNGFLVETLNLAKFKIEFCLGCRKCFDYGEDNCPIKDDVKEIIKKIDNCNLLIIGSPIYVEDINGILKSLIDRMAYNSHRPGFYSKNAYVLCTSGVGSTNHGITTVIRPLQTWGFNIIGSARYITGAKITTNELLNKYTKKIDKEIKGIVKNLKENSKPSIISLLYFSMQQRYYLKNNTKDSYDYNYWERKGWLESKRCYYTDTKVNKITSFLISCLCFIIDEAFLR